MTGIIKRYAAVVLFFASCVVLPSSARCQPAQQAEKYLPATERYNYIFGTQTIGPAYKFTNDTKLVETAKRIREMGSNILKISLDPAKYSDIKFTPNASMVEVLKNEPSYKSVMAMDFNYYFLWAYAPGVKWLDGMSATEKETEYNSTKELAVYLLTTYNHSGKEFYLGHWEGDWQLLDNFNPFQKKVDSVKLQGMTDWYNIRQKAIEDALSATPHQDVKVWQYAEISEINGAMRNGYDRVINSVLPNTNIDFISYSSYVSVNIAEYDGLHKELRSALDYIEKHLPAKPGITGKRVFIGEYGYPRIYIGSDEEQARRTKLVMRTALEWGCPFVLYWELYNNEIDRNGNQIGYWMIDHNNQKLPTWQTHADFYSTMKKWVNDFTVQNGRAPAAEIFQQQALKILQ
jgi:hypothetical protein